MQPLCVETLPGDYELVAHVHVRDQQAEVSSQPSLRCAPLEPRRRGLDVNHETRWFNSIISGCSPMGDILNRAILIESQKRRGPALPGLRNKTPSWISARGLCEWPNTIAVSPASAGWTASCERSCRTKMRWPPTSTRVGLGQLFCPSRAINVAAHRYDGRNLAQAFEYLGLDDISGMNNQFRPT
jgi:hypothetical protein